MTRDQDRDAVRGARRRAAAAAVEERFRLAVESAPPLPADVEARIRQLILAHGPAPGSPRPCSACTAP